MSDNPQGSKLSAEEISALDVMAKLSAVYAQNILHEMMTTTCLPSACVTANTPVALDNETINRCC